MFQKEKSKASKKKCKERQSKARNQGFGIWEILNHGGSSCADQPYSLEELVFYDDILCDEW